MAFREALEQMKPSAHHSLQIFATDLDKDAIDTARIGAYPDNIAADVSEERLRRFFVQEERVLIYLETDLQKKFLPLFHYALNPGGILMLGNSETVGAAARKHA